MDFFGKKKIAVLTKQLQDAEKSLVECNEKLIEKQEHINKTNAYWKKKMRDLQQKNKKK
jgi:hypothetical protein